MSSSRNPLRFVEKSAPRAKTIPQATWALYKDELCAMYQEMTLDGVMEAMALKYPDFRPTPRQLIYKFEQWNQKKYNTMDRDDLGRMAAPGRPQVPMDSSFREQCSSDPPLIPPKRTRSVISVQSRNSHRSFCNHSQVPVKKRSKLVTYIADRSQARLASAFDGAFDGSSTSRFLILNRSSSSLPTQPTSHLATIGLSLASTGRPISRPPFSRSEPGSPSSMRSSHVMTPFSTVTPSQTGSDGPQGLFGQSRMNHLLCRLYNTKATHEHQDVRRLRRQFDNSRDMDTFSLDDLADMETAAHFLHAVGANSDSFDLFTILFKHSEEFSAEPAHIQKSTLIRWARSSAAAAQTGTARTELEKAIDACRFTLKDAERFLCRMLLAEKCTRSDGRGEDGFRKESLEEITSDVFLDRLPKKHRRYDMLTYHYLNKCLNDLNDLVHFGDGSAVFTDKNTLQTRVLERIPGPFELRHEKMQNCCLRSCITWCVQSLRSNPALPEKSIAFRADGDRDIRWTEYVILYCVLYQQWQAERRAHDVVLASWMLDAQERMGLHPAELLSVVAKMIVLEASPPLGSRVNLIVRAKSGVCHLSVRPDKELGFSFLDTYSIANDFSDHGTDLPRNNWVSFFATTINSGRERQHLQNQVRMFARSFIEDDLNITLPEVESDHPTKGFSISLPIRAGREAESTATTIAPSLSTSLHSMTLSNMREICVEARSSSDQCTCAIPGTICKIAMRSCTTISLLSEAMMSNLSLTSTQQKRNASFDSLAAASSNNFVATSDMSCV